MGLLVGVFRAGILVFESADKEFARAGNVEVDITVHGVLAQHVNAEFLARLSKAEESVEGEDVGE